MSAFATLAADLDAALADGLPLRFPPGHPACAALGLPAGTAFVLDDGAGGAPAVSQGPVRLNVSGRIAEGSQSYSVPPLGDAVALTVTSVSVDFTDDGTGGVRVASVPTAAQLTNATAGFSLDLVGAAATVPVPAGGFALAGTGSSLTLDALATALGLGTTSLAGVKFTGTPSFSFAGIISGSAILGLQLAIDVVLSDGVIGTLPFGQMTATIYAGGTSIASSALRFGWSLQAIYEPDGSATAYSILPDPAGWRLNANLASAPDPDTAAQMFFSGLVPSAQLGEYGASLSWTTDRLEIVTNSAGVAQSGSLVATGSNAAGAQVLNAIVVLPSLTLTMSAPCQPKQGDDTPTPLIGSQTFNDVLTATQVAGPELETSPAGLLVSDINYSYATQPGGSKPTASFRVGLQGDLVLGPFTITAITFAYYGGATGSLALFNAQLSMNGGEKLSLSGTSTTAKWSIGVNADFTGAGIKIDQFLQNLWSGAPTYYLADISLKVFAASPTAYSLVTHICEDLTAPPSGDLALFFYFGQNYLNFAGARSFLVALGPIDPEFAIFDWVTIEVENFYVVFAPVSFTAPYLDTTIPFGPVTFGATVVPGTVTFQPGSAFSSTGETATRYGLPMLPPPAPRQYAPRGLRDPNALPASQSNAVVPVQQSSGGINLQSVSFAWDGTRFTADITGGYTFGKLTLEAVGLTIGTTLPLNAVPTIGLDGFGVQWGDPKAPPSFTGMVDWATPVAGFSFFGSGTLTFPKGNCTMLVAGGPHNLSFGFVLLNGIALGGPSFNVTSIGFVAGSGCTLSMPSFANLANYPLVQAILPGGTNPFANVNTAAGAFGKLDLEPDPQGQGGTFMLAIGAQSCGIANIAAIGGINATATDTIVDLLGTVVFSRPFSPAQSFEATNVNLGFEASLDPGAGLFQVTLQVLPGSWLINPALTAANPALTQALTGGAAFDLWFGDNPYAGDWVLSIGGYNPNITLPPYYPVVPRINWTIRPNVGGSSLSGTAYGTFCSSGIMFGAGLSATWSETGWSGSCDLSFDAYILFHGGFGVDVNVQFSCSINVHIIVHIDIELSIGIALSIGASPFHGSFSLYVQGFSISHSFGDTQDSPSLTWAGMASAYLTAGAGSGTSSALADGSGTAQPLSIAISAGALPTQVATPAGQPIVVHGGDLAWSATTTIPITTITGLGETLSPPSTEFGIAMLDSTPVTSVFDVEIVNSRGNAMALTCSSTLQTSGAPPALWSVPGGAGGGDLAPMAIGANYALVQAPPQLGQPVSVAVLTEPSPETVTPSWIGATVPTTDPYGADDALAEIKTIDAPGVAAARTAVLDWFGAAGFPVSSNIVDVAAFPAAVSLFRAEPLLRVPGEILATEALS